MSRESVDITQGYRCICPVCRQSTNDTAREDVLTGSVGDSPETAAVGIVMMVHPQCRAAAIMLRQEIEEAILAVFVSHWA